MYDYDHNPAFSDRSVKNILYPILSECVKKTGGFELGLSLEISTQTKTFSEVTSVETIGRNIYASFKYPLMSPILASAIRERYDLNSPEQPEARVFLNIRSHNKRHLNISECIDRLINASAGNKEAKVIINQARLAFDVETSSVDDSVLSLVHAIREAGLDCHLHERLDIDELCSLVAKCKLCICPIGSGAILPTWIYNKPTILHGDKMHMKQLNWWGSVPMNEQRLYPVDQKAITDTTSQGYSDYLIDPDVYSMTFWGAFEAAILELEKAHKRSLGSFMTQKHP